MPPAMAPYMLIKPPTMLAANTLGMSSGPRLGSPWNHSDMRAPATPATPPPSIHATPYTSFTLMPTVPARSAFSVDALIAMPNFVRLSMTWSTIIRAAIATGAAMTIRGIPDTCAS